jgi:hypothetical protein
VQLQVLSHYTQAKFGFSYSEYPPFFFSMVAPFTLLPIDLAYIVWCLDSILLSFAGLALLAKRACGLSWKQIALVFFCTLLSAPGVQTFALGQSSLILLPIAAFFCWTIIRKMDTLTGAAIALSTIKPQYAPFLCIIPLSTGRWWMLIVAVLGEIVLLLLAAATIGWRNVIHYPRVIAALDSGRIPAPIFMEYLVSIRQPLKLLPYPLPLVLGLTILAVGAAALFYLWRLATKTKVATETENELIIAYDNRKNLVERWLLAATIMVALALSFHTHLHDCVLLSLPAVLTLPTLSLSRAFKLKPVALRFWTIGFLFYPLLGMLVYVYLDFNPDLKYGLFFFFNLLACLLSLWISAQLLRTAPKP